MTGHQALNYLAEQAERAAFPLHEHEGALARHRQSVTVLACLLRELEGWRAGTLKPGVQPD
jgi:hypothetical protein